jgi:prepilin-type processing-associated H-X9-DG protein
MDSDPGTNTAPAADNSPPSPREWSGDLDSPPSQREGLGEGAPADFRNGIATAAFVVGLLSIPLAPLGIVAAVLGIIGLLRARADVDSRGAMPAIGGIVLGVGMLTLLSILYQGRAISMRPVCASNLRGIGQACAVYAKDNDGWFPVAPCLEVDPNEPGNTSRVAFVGALGRHFDRPLAGEELATVHPSRSMFMLVTEGFCTAKQFICPSSGATEDDLRNAANTNSCEPGVNRFDFKAYDNLSYGYQLPFGPRGRPRRDLDPKMAVMADKGPFFDAASSQGLVTPDRYAPDYTAGMAVALRGVSPTDADALRRARAGRWGPLNSRNHGGKGQNVLFADGHVEWADKPIVGVDRDNIYTVQRDATPAGVMLGNVPADYVGPLTNTDSVIVP